MYAAIRHFLALNLIVGVAFWVFTSNRPVRLDLSLDTSGPVSYVELESSRQFSFNGTNSEWYVWINDRPDDEKLVLERVGNCDWIRPLSARLRARLLFDLNWDARAIDIVDGGRQLVLDFAKAKSGCSVRRLLVVLAAELGLLLLAWLLSRLAIAKPTLPHSSSLVRSATVALGWMLFAGLVIPVQTYLMNRGEFNAELSAVISDAAFDATLSGAVFFALLYSCVRLGGRIYLLLAAGALAYVYLETGPLSFDFPQYTGDVNFYKGGLRKALDSAALLGMMFALGLAGRSFRRLELYAVGVVVLLGMASLFDTHSQPTINRHVAGVNLFGGRVSVCSKSAAMHEAFYSARRNVLVYVIDCVPTACALEAFR